jgi:triacylglycerol lipase
MNLGETVPIRPIRLLTCLALVFPALIATAHADPSLTVPKAKLAAALHCQASVRNASRTPVLLVTGTGVDGHEAWPAGLQVSLTRAHIPSCYLDFPEHTTADIQISAQYLVAGIRATAKRAGRKIAIFGISQGGLLPRYSLTYWPSLRSLVTDAVLVSGTQHGTTVFGSLTGSCAPNCRFTAAAWQQAAGSKLLTALNKTPDETPGSVSYTTVRSTTDEVVQPTGGPHPTAALKGASNIVIQNVCPGRATTHIGTGVDSVSYAVLIDAIGHPGPASVKRLPKGVCAHLYAPGLDDTKTTKQIQDLLTLATARTLSGTDGGHLLSAEPALKSYATHR